MSDVQKLLVDLCLLLEGSQANFANNVLTQDWCSPRQQDMLLKFVRDAVQLRAVPKPRVTNYGYDTYSNDAHDNEYGGLHSDDFELWNDYQ